MMIQYDTSWMAQLSEHADLTDSDVHRRVLQFLLYSEEHVVSEHARALLSTLEEWDEAMRLKPHAALQHTRRLMRKLNEHLDPLRENSGLTTLWSLW